MKNKDIYVCVYIYIFIFFSLKVFVFYAKRFVCWLSLFFVNKKVGLWDAVPLPV